MDYKEKIQKLINGEMIDGIRASEIQIGVLKALFPEFTESEDERIRKYLIRVTEGQHSSNFPTIEGFSREQILSWLEKQGKQKPIDKVEPKFKVGDWIIHDKNIKLANSLILVTGKDNNEYLCKDINGQCSYNIEFIDKDYHLWTILDAKDGDVLTTDMVIFIFKEIKDKSVFMYCCHGYNSFTVSDTAEVNAEYVHPATKEQRDLLFQKMKEAGYEWDAEKKQLKKIEQKPITHNEKKIYWSEGDETTKNNISHIIRQYDKISKRDNKPCWYVGDCLLWMQNIRDRVQQQHKQGWNEKDERRIEECAREAEDRLSEDIPYWKKSTLPNDSVTGFNSDFFSYNGYCINYKELFDKLPKED